ncbi:MAG: hypothetical protein Q4G63_00070 [Bacteroidia bacterium]|nr:hypothetical protein [Bacteroidia bacterium]
MKKLFITLSVICLAVFTTTAQTTFHKGANVVNFGVGIGSSYYGSGYKMAVPPLAASYEYGVVDGLFDGKGSIGVGALVGFTSAKWNHINNDSYNVNYMTFAGRGNLHYQFVENLDTYAGLTLGYYLVNQKWPEGYVGPKNNGALAWGLNVGARYYFQPNIAAMAEVGYGISILNLGIAFKF